MSLGIALGGFMSGFSQGVQTGQYIHEARKQRRLENTVEGITKTGKADYDAAVAAGTEDPGDFMSYYSNKLVPEIAAAHLENGDPAKAQAWTDWAESTTTKKAAKLFNSGLGKFQSGDTEGAVKDMQKAANTKGYGPDGKMSVAEYYDEQAGAVTGYRVSFTTPDGEEHSKNVAAADLPKFFAGVIAPQTAFELQLAQDASKAKADLEVETYGRKKQLDKQLGTGTGALTQAQYQNAIQEERKAIEANALTDPELTDLTGAEKEALAKANVDARFSSMGQPAAPTEQVAVDPTTGEPVAAETPTTDAAAAAPTDESLGITPTADTPTEENPAPEAAPQPVLQAPAAPQAPTDAATPAAATSQVDPGMQQQYLAQASQMMRQGGDAQKIAAALLAAGISPQQWPQDVRMAAQSGQMGIGR
jgi:hypothetical protein